MSELKITFKLGDEDLTHLKRVMREAAAAAQHKSHENIADAALAVVERVREAKPPAYILERVATLEQIGMMLQDADWRLPHSVKNRVCSALAYFAEPQDLIPDHIPVLGFLDDAIIIEIVAREFEHEIQGYRGFCRSRASLSRRLSRSEQQPLLRKRLVEQRRQIRARIQARRAQDGSRALRGRFKFW